MHILTIFNILFKTVRQGFFYNSDLFESHFQWTFSSQQKIILVFFYDSKETPKPTPRVDSNK